MAIPSASPAKIIVLPNNFGFSLIAPTALEATIATAIPAPIQANPVASATAMSPKPLIIIDRCRIFFSSSIANWYRCIFCCRYGLSLTCCICCSCCLHSRDSQYDTYHQNTNYFRNLFYHLSLPFLFFYLFYLNRLIFFPITLIETAK